MTAIPFPVPGPTRRFIRYALAFGCAVGVGLAPLLGRLHWPLFTSILELFPLNLREAVIAFAAFVMGIPSLAVQFYRLETLDRRMLRRLFGITLFFLLISFIALYSVFTFSVVDVPIRGGDAAMRYVIGVTERTNCECVKRQADIRECIGRYISSNPSVVEACYPRIEVQRHKLYLSLAYFALMASFGTLIGLLILREGLRRTRAQP